VGMALDEPKEQDREFKLQDWTFIMEPEVESMVAQGGGVSIDFVDDGFRKGYTVQIGNAGECGEGGCGSCDCS